MKTIIVTGAASGVGREVSLTYKDENLILIDNNKKKLELLSKKLGDKHSYFVCDISDMEQLQETFKLIEKKYKKIDVLVHCAAVWTKGNMTEQDEGHFAEINTFERIKQLIDVNVYGLIAMVKSVLPFMKKQGYGQIININSSCGVNIEEPWPVYTASKHGAHAFSKAIMNDLIKNKIKLTDIHPGLINTDFYINANDPLPKEIMDTGLRAKDVANVVKYLVELPKDIAIPSIEIKNMKNI